MRNIESYSFSSHMQQKQCREEIIVSSSEFDTGAELLPENIQAYINQATNEMAELGYSLSKIKDVGHIQNETEAHERCAVIHDVATILFVQWERSRQTKDKVAELAFARLVNGLTKAARELHDRFALFDTTHIEILGEFLADEFSKERLTGEIDVQAIANELNWAAEQRTHEVSWPWVVLPTFPNQHYGRILLHKVPTADERYPIFITQPTFLSNEATQFHTHGQNWAFARPLGRAINRENSHINTLWEPQNEVTIFPLKLADKSHYDSSTVVIIPPLAIHGISGVRRENQLLPSLVELKNNPDLLNQFSDVRFGEQSSMHIYLPDPRLSIELSKSPLVQENAAFFIENDMIVFDHKQQAVWSGGGGAWSRRMVEYGRTGEHCGACFVENDPRQENLDQSIILHSYIQLQNPKIVGFQYS